MGKYLMARMMQLFAALEAFLAPDLAAYKKTIAQDGQVFKALGE